MEMSKSIDNLQVSDSIKEALRKIEIVVSSENENVKSTVKDLFIVGPTCKELSEIARCYERIIVRNSVCSIHGARTYLELAFPATGDRNELNGFFASPRLAAATQNSFTGVFLISFVRWENANSLLQNVGFQKLLEFVEENKSNISFVFHVTPEFKNRGILENELSKYVNLCSLEHSFPDVEAAVKYVEKQCEETGIILEEEAKNEMKQLIEEKIVVDCKLDYSILERFAANFQFEAYAYFSLVKDKEKKQEMRVGKREMEFITKNIEMPKHKMASSNKIGFR